MSGPVVQQALAYAARGWSVFPVHSIKHGQCTCSNKSTCSRPGKHPRTEKGLLEASDALVKLAMLAKYGRYKDSIIEDARLKVEGVP